MSPDKEVKMKNLIKLITSIKTVVDVQALVNSTDLYNEGILDSFDILNLIARLENAYNIEICAADLSREDFMTVNNICELVFKNGGKI